MDLAFDRKAISVVICAFSLARWDDLCRAVESVRRQTLAPAEIVVVIDHSPELFERARREFSGALVIASGASPGLSGARNSGLAAAGGDVVAFLDDDAFAQPEWLEALAEGYSDERAIGVGGHIEPAWDAGRPRWFPPEFDWVVGCTYAGMASSGARDLRNLIGANMSFRRELLLESGGFHSDLGRTGRSATGDEETEACIRLKRLNPGSVLLHVPSAVVVHRVPAERGRLAYFMSRCWSEGLSKARMTRLTGTRDGLSSERRHAFRTLPRAFARDVARGEPARAAATALGLAAASAGYAAGSVSRALRRQPAASRTPVGGDGRRLRLLVVTPRFAPLVGGVEHHVEEVARRTAEYADVTVLTTDTSGSLPAEQTVRGVRVVRVRAWPRDRDWRFARGIGRIVAEGDWDLVHVQSYHTAVAPLAMRAAARAGVPYVVTFHGGGHSSRLRRVLRRPQQSLLRPLLARAAKLVAVADFEAEHFSRHLRIPRERFAVIPNGSDLPAAPAVERDGLAIGSVGRLERYKGHHRVIEAMPLVLAQEPGARLHVLGSGPYGEPLRRLAQRLGVDDAVAVRAIPSSDRAEMARALAGLSLVVLMSEFETHPLAVLEALALGTPALVADTSGLHELAARGLVRAVPVDSTPAELARAILDDLRRPREVPHLALPTWDTCAEELRRVYEEVARDRPRPVPADERLAKAE